MSSSTFVILLITALSAGVCFHLAGKKGLNQPLWTVMGLLFGPLAVLVILFISPKK